MECIICNQPTLDLKAKVPLIFDNPLVCRVCGSRYKKVEFLKVKSSILSSVLEFFSNLSIFSGAFSIVGILLFAWLVFLLQYWVLLPAIVGFTIWYFFLSFEYDGEDTINRVIARKYAKKDYLNKNNKK